MTRVVETVAAEFGDRVRVDIVYTKDLSGALQYAEISRRLGRPAPVPAILVEDELAFDRTPAAERLRAYLMHVCKEKQGN